MSSNRFCPTHNKELKHFEGISKKTGKPYTMWKCTAKVGEGWCDHVEWPDNGFSGGTTPAYKQAPSGVVKEESKPWPPEIVRVLNQINEKLDEVVDNTRFVRDRTQQ